MFRPKPPDGGNWCAASPTRNTRSGPCAPPAPGAEKAAATAASIDHGRAPHTSHPTSPRRPRRPSVVTCASGEASGGRAGPMTAAMLRWHSASDSSPVSSGGEKGTCAGTDAQGAGGSAPRRQALTKMRGRAHGPGSAEERRSGGGELRGNAEMRRIGDEEAWTRGGEEERRGEEEERRMGGTEGHATRRSGTWATHSPAARSWATTQAMDAGLKTK